MAARTMINLSSCRASINQMLVRHKAGLPSPSNLMGPFSVVNPLARDLNTDEGSSDRLLSDIRRSDGERFLQMLKDHPFGEPFMAHPRGPPLRGPSPPKKEEIDDSECEDHEDDDEDEEDDDFSAEDFDDDDDDDDEDYDDEFSEEEKAGGKKKKNF